MSSKFDAFQQWGWGRNPFDSSLPFPSPTLLNPTSRTLLSLAPGPGSWLIFPLLPHCPPRRPALRGPLPRAQHGGRRGAGTADRPTGGQQGEGPPRRAPKLTRQRRSGAPGAATARPRGRRSEAPPPLACAEGGPRHRSRSPLGQEALSAAASPWARSPQP